MVLTAYYWGMVGQDDFKMDLSPYEGVWIVHIMMIQIIVSWIVHIAKQYFKLLMMTKSVYRYVIKFN